MICALLAVSFTGFRLCREDAREERGDQLGNHADEASFLADVKNTKPKRHHARQWQRNVHDTNACRVECAVDYFLKYLRITQKNPLSQCRQKSDDKKTGPKIGQCHVEVVSIGCRLCLGGEAAFVSWFAAGFAVVATDR